METEILSIPPNVLQYGTGGIAFYLLSRIVIEVLKIKKNDLKELNDSLSEIVIEQKKQSLEIKNLCSSINSLANSLERSHEIMRKHLESTTQIRQEVQGLSMRLKIRGDNDF